MPGDRCRTISSAQTGTSQPTSSPQAAGKGTPSPERKAPEPPSKTGSKPEIEIDPLRAICNLPGADEDSESGGTADTTGIMQTADAKGSKL